ncbi:MAG: tetraacyldisaccharide 4'-kinase, partial [Betaproteobacteria bacterium]|nr:tetraacyldisaccharide 4'-kinase [Betaproteobacteria bacterium]
MPAPRTNPWCASWRPPGWRGCPRSPSLRSPRSSRPPGVEHWYRPSALRWLLWPASLLYGAIAAARRLLYRLRLLPRHRVGVPVIVVGNLVAGGSGKTPLVLWLAAFMKQNGRRPGIVSRGYGGAMAAKGGAPREATIASDPAEVGDEPMLLARRSGCPVWVAPERIAACRALRAQHPDCDLIILDDGLQHYALARDVEICVVDGRGFGNGMLLPAGPLREPASRLASVDAVVSHGAALKGFSMKLKGAELVRIADASDRRVAADFKGQRVHAVAGIGDPNRFFA